MSRRRTGIGKAPSLPFLEAVDAHPRERAVAHMAASLLLEYPTQELRDRHALLRDATGILSDPVAAAFARYLDAADALDLDAQQAHYVETFDLRRRCALYLTYYAAGDTRRRGMALVTFVEAYRACGWVPRDDELPDYLPTVLELSSREQSHEQSAVADTLLGSHRAGIELLRSALHHVQTPYAEVLDAVCLTLPAVDEATAARFAELVSSGPPSETVGLSAPLLPFPTVRSEVPA
ncbi:nitrate reductase molybdenum cofactor assembly chaperone [Cellulomonas sp. URHD0024]|uniref:nitrate reductase molybdenum cofactor assembly chaperone n=1 Tax=Cellulomonas sp. URHD0024 TaxID=1302620 RepID=UPI0004135CE2|nr:nitrate reductase molybdenum cofactor assembly chaperone [Cellulomonas sp. URHD0024]